jgi:hypothetical protein
MALMRAVGRLDTDRHERVSDADRDATPRPLTGREERVVMAAQTAVKGDQLGLVSELIDTGNVDTVYRDLYVQRARTWMAGVLPIEEFRRLQQDKSDLATLPIKIGRAVERADWSQVKELSSRGETLRRAAADKQRQIDMARAVYDVNDIRLDPFSPGLGAFTRLSGGALSALRAETIEHLGSLQQADASWREFYAGRRAALQALAVTTTSQSASPEAVSSAAVDPQEAAQRALKAGDLRSLSALADTMMAAVTSAVKGAAAPAKRGAVSPEAASEPRSQDLLTTYSDDTLKGARRLGLGVRHLEPRTELAAMRQYAWNPLVDDDSERINVKQVPLPADTPEGFRERLEMLMIHPVVNSGGARHLPSLVAEDVLVEDFPDPREGEQAPASELLTILGFTGRRALPRSAIEQALLAHGADVVERELKLDPRGYRLVCIPPDVHLRLGEAEGWGRQAYWTHFDGYLVMADGRLRALAGGEARYGGLFNLLGIGRDYDSDRVMARFAVVRRERMVAW